jgi:hypothetical protein
MKFKLAVVAAISLLSAVSFGASENNSGQIQTEAPRRSSSEERIIRRINPQAGLIWSEYRGTDNKVYFGSNGFSAGATLDLFGTQKMVFETGLLYRQRNASADSGFGTTTFTARYLSVPADLKYYFNGQENTSLYIKAGAMGSNLLDSNTTRTVSGSTVNFNADQWELDGITGLGLKFYLSPSTDLFVEADYQRPWSNMFNGNYAYSALSANAGFGVNL